MKEDLSKGIQKTYGEMFSFIGEEMVKGEAGWEDYAAVAVQGIAQILQALGSELIALAAARASHYDFGTAAVAATAATAAFVSSGVLTAVSSAMKSTAETIDSSVSSLDNWRSSIESLHDTITDLVESAVDFNGFITAVTQADDMIAAATSNYEKAIKQYENFAAELGLTTLQKLRVVILKECRKAFETAQDLDDYTQNSFANSLGKRLVADLGSAFPDATAEQKDQWMSTFMKNYTGSENAGKPLLKDYGIEYDVLDTGVADNRASELTSNRELQQKIICQIFGVPVQYLGISDSFDLENVSTMFITNALRPLCQAFEVDDPPKIAGRYTCTLL